MTPDEYETRHGELLERVPAEFRSFLSSYAWQEGHAYGFEEVLSYLAELADGLAPAIENYAARIRRN